MKKFFTSIFSLLLTTSAANADEGMWMMHGLPQAVFERMQAYGYKLPVQSLTPPMQADSTSGCKTLAAAVVNFSGYCTGVVVSPDGLLMTNHHCGFEAIRSHSTVEHDYMLNGFVADSLKDELPNEGMFVAFMKRQDDVTDRLRSMGLDTLSDFDRGMLIDSLEQVLTDEASAADSTLYVEIDPFYEGNAYYATTYRRYDDVRLVMALPKSMGKFGGERDNWMWPRQTCDFSVFRVYADPETGMPAEYSERNVPLNTQDYIQVSADGYHDGDFAMTIGYPGSTERYLSSYGIEQMRDCVNDPMQQVRGVKQQVMKRHMDSSEEVRIKYDSKYAQSSNYWKNAIGMNKCIDSIGIVQMKRGFEQRLTQWLDTTCAYSTPLSFPTLAQLYAKQKKAMRAYTLYTETFTRRANNELATRATRYCDGMPVKGPQNRPRKQYMQFDDNSNAWDRELDIDVLAALLSNYREQVERDSMQEFLPSFYETIDRDYAGNYRSYVEYVWDNSILMTTRRIPLRLSKKLQRDPGIVMSMSLVETLADIRLMLDQVKDSINEQERLLCAAKLRMEQEQPHYSDANFTMRLSYGQIGGYTIGSSNSGYMTTPQSMIDKIMLWERDTVLSPNPYEEYFAEPVFKDLLHQYAADWHREFRSENRDESESDNEVCPPALCFLSNNDITGGNSGSPVINGHGQVIGLAFDGTWDSLSSDIYFDATLARTISVDIRYVLFMMRHWAHAERLLREMGVSKSF